MVRSVPGSPPGSWNISDILRCAGADLESSAFLDAPSVPYVSARVHPDAAAITPMPCALGEGLKTPSHGATPTTVSAISFRVSVPALIARAVVAHLALKPSKWLFFIVQRVLGLSAYEFISGWARFWGTKLRIFSVPKAIWDSGTCSSPWWARSLPRRVDCRTAALILDAIHGCRPRGRGLAFHPLGALRAMVYGACAGAGFDGAAWRESMPLSVSAHRR